MNTNTTVQVAGVKETINALKQIDPELQKQFKADATQIAKPAINAVQAKYTKVPLSNMSRDWKWHKRNPPQKIKGFDLNRARRGVQMKFDTRRNAIGVILIIQKDQAAAIFETAGRANASMLSKNLGDVQPGRTRIIGPAVYRARKGIEREMQQMINTTSSMIARRM